jgi:hypothetical protein
LIGFLQDRDHLFFGESPLAHGSLPGPAGAILSSFSWSENPQAGHLARSSRMFVVGHIMRGILR